MLESFGVTPDVRALADATANGSHYVLARIISQSKKVYRVVTDSGECSAEITGKLRHAARSAVDFPAVGDFVLIEENASTGKGVICTILKRRTVLSRTESGASTRTQMIATNIDVVFICVSLNANYNPNRIERYLSLVREGGASAVIVLTKADLQEDHADILTEVHSLAGDTPVVVTRMDDRAACERLLAYLPAGTTSAFVGSSGVGKSTLINILAGDDIQETGAIRESDDKGRHTTSRREMIPLPNGACVVDTPGMRELGVDTADVQTSFPDIEELARQCRFSNCRHQTEPGCAVRQAVSEGRLDRRRLENYRRLKEEHRIAQSPWLRK